MKINEDLLIYTKIESYDGRWEMGANLSKNGYYSPFLQSNSPLLSFEADADNWLIQLYENLKELIKPKEERDLEKFNKALSFEKEEITEIPEEDYPIIVDLLEQAITLGFFREYYDKSK